MVGNSTDKSNMTFEGKLDVDASGVAGKLISAPAMTVPANVAANVTATNCA